MQSRHWYRWAQRIASRRPATPVRSNANGLVIPCPLVFRQNRREVGWSVWPASNAIRHDHGDIFCARSGQSDESDGTYAESPWANQYRSSPRRSSLRTDGSARPVALSKKSIEWQSPVLAERDLAANGHCANQPNLLVVLVLATPDRIMGGGRTLTARKCFER
jgi:hypothetical protein